MVYNKDIMKWLKKLHFAYWNGLIYYIDDTNEHKCLCISSQFEKKIFKIVHDHQHHSGFHRTYNYISASLFLQHLTRHLKTYILHCSECQINQMKRHALYESLHSISILSIFFHTITMNFILTLSFTSDYDNLLTVMNKFIKCMLLLSETFIYSAVNWTNMLLSDLIDHNWEILHQIISDCDQKFLSSFWHIIFERLETQLLTLMVYHSQMNDQFKQINQTVKITL